MNDKNDDVLTTVLGSGFFLIVGGLIVFAIASAREDAYKQGIKDSPATVNVAGDQIITNTSSNLSAFSGNGNKSHKGTK
ncbi:MAG: hypothetical protein AV945_gp52 [Phormidium phage MIS-PhV1B]|jgi:hypothetical protein|uniref:hypothetical protein n=1 Tax=Phormidium phage MIS-PhV1B TaxID=1391456 RepID=UPI0003C9C3F7|nr:MAG: hypothetical protein AV945_gp52 [Phormidium phage MIS-PhV1B]AGZ61859.1 MAG: hypothetical protein [Phormidium phage MIS-PhV1B]